MKPGRVEASAVPTPVDDDDDPEEIDALTNLYLGAAEKG